MHCLTRCVLSWEPDRRREERTQPSHCEYYFFAAYVVLQYIVPLLAIPLLIAFKYGKPRRYLFDFVEWHTKPRIYCGLERDSQQTVGYLKEDQPECL